MILLIDNYDSFVYNLARYFQQLGHDTLVLRNDAVSLDNITHDIQPSHIILSPGPCTPNEAGLCLSLIKQFKARFPILGVCLGHQAIAQALGAKIIPATLPMHGKASKIWHNNQGVFSHIENPVEVARYHSLTVDPNTLPTCLTVTAHSAEDEIMAIQHNEFPLVGVQFHPESVLTTCGYRLLKNFLSLKISNPNQCA
jgi:anthranilate synthase/aminodeoxychorismate synthase-like glutamine amidotransferase